MAVSGADAALPLIQDWKPDVIVLDIGLPGRDGYSLIQQIRALPPGEGGGIPAIALTAYASIEDRHRALAAGFQIHIAKPADPSTVVEAVALIAATSGP
jgi:CheY-like chemotaxis protein